MPVFYFLAFLGTGRLSGISALFARSNPVVTSKNIKGLQGLPVQAGSVSSRNSGVTILPILSNLIDTSFSV